MRELLPQGRCGTAGITDHPGIAQIAGQPGRWRSPLQTPPRWWWWPALAVGGWQLTHQLRRQMQHQARFSQAGMQAGAALGLRDQLGQARRAAPDEARQHGELGRAGPQLARCCLQQRDLAAVGVEQHQPLKARGSQLTTHGHHLGDQQLCRQGQGAGKALVFRRKAQALQGQPPDRLTWLEVGQHLIEQAIGKQGIGSQRQVRTVLLHRSPGPDHRAARTRSSSCHGDRAELGEASAHGFGIDHYSVGLQARSVAMAGSGNSASASSPNPAPSSRPVPPREPRRPSEPPQRRPPQVLMLKKDGGGTPAEAEPAEAVPPTPATAPAAQAAAPTPQAAAPATPAGRSEEDLFDMSAMAGLTMADLLGPADQRPRRQSGNREPQLQRGSAGAPAVQVVRRSVDDFDFDEEAFLAALDENEPVGTTGDVVQGVVISVESDGVYVDIGGKAPGFMPKSEAGLGVITNLKERFPKGMPVEVLVTREQNADGMVTISARALALRQSWEKVRQLEKDGKVVQVKVNGFNRGGVTCDLEGLRAFIPRSQLQEGEQHEALVGKTLGVAFLEVNAETRKLVLSEKKAATAARFAELAVGHLVEGVVASIKPYGYFIDLGGISGLLHQSCVSGGQLRDLREVFNSGDRVRALITELDPGRGRIALNTALLEAQPGEILIARDQLYAEAEERANRARSLLRQQEQAAG